MREKVFVFKKFSVINDMSAMKVGTDGVLIGAWTDVSHNTSSVLDVGSGSGLVSLMIAQRTENANITGVEIDSKACDESIINIQNSPWLDRIKILNVDFKHFVTEGKSRYDLIISNPPFFTNGLRAPEKGRAVARHDDSLPLNVFLSGCAKLLSEGGRLSFIYSSSEKNRILKLAAELGLYPLHITDVYPTPDSDVKRVLFEFSNVKERTETDKLVIELSRHVYTDNYINLTKDFYLRM